jgi:hypothetical protein
VYDLPEDDLRVPEVEIRNPSNIFHYERPHFILAGPDDVEKVWWQICEEPDFRFIIPNFEQIQGYSGKITLSGITSSFFRDNEAYFFRIRAKRDGVWGNWTRPFRFVVLKPEQPHEARIHSLPNGEYRLRWEGPPARDVEYWIFGSNRLDFVPEIYTDTEITRMRNGVVTGSRPNRNLVARTEERFWNLREKHHFYRIAAMKGDAFSTPSELIAFPSGGSQPSPKLPPPKVLQTRWKKIVGEQFKNGYRDIYESTEKELTRLKR